MSAAVRPTRREERRAQTVAEIKQLAMEQISSGGPDAVSLSGIVRSMSMSPAALYRYFANRDALLADLVVDAYDDLADSLVALQQSRGSAERHLDAILNGIRDWALDHPNAYRLIFQNSVGSGEDFAAERTIAASSRSMAVIVEALAAAAGHDDARFAPIRQDAAAPEVDGELTRAFAAWAERSDAGHIPTAVLVLAFLAWTRLHGVISLELGGHLAATGIGARVLFDAEVATIHAQVTALPAVANQ